MGDVYGLLLVSDPSREDNVSSSSSSTVSVLFSTTVSPFNHPESSLDQANRYSSALIRDGLKAIAIASCPSADPQCRRVASARRATLFTLRRETRMPGRRFTPRSAIRDPRSANYTIADKFWVGYRAYAMFRFVGRQRGFSGSVSENRMVLRILITMTGRDAVRGNTMAFCKQLNMNS